MTFDGDRPDPKLVRIAGWLLIATTALTLLAAPTVDRSRIEVYMNGFQRPLLALQLAESAEDVAGILKGNVGAIEGSLWINYALIPVYTAFLVSMAIIFLGWSFAWSRPLYVLAIALSLVTAAVDLLENFQTSALVTASLSGVATHYMEGVRHATLIKWACFNMVLMLLFLGFLARTDWIVLIGLLLGASGALGLGGASAAALGIGGGGAALGIEYAAYPMVPGFSLLAFVLILTPKQLFVDSA